MYFTGIIIAAMNLAECDATLRIFRSKNLAISPEMIRGSDFLKLYK